jgi:CRP/FNR family transcriptional regulator, cyclic AMP receptor protein
MEKLFASLPVRKLSKGQILIYEGDPVENIYLLVNGYVKVSNILDNGRQRTIIVYAPGEAFPLTSFLSGFGIARYFYECMTDVEIKVMPQKDMQKKIKGNLAVGEELIAYSYEMSSQFIERIEILSARSARHKVAALLNYLAGKTGNIENDGSVRLSLPLTSQEIADMCGLTRETASMQLQRMKRDGIVGGARHLLINKAKLARLIRY